MMVEGIGGWWKGGTSPYHFGSHSASYNTVIWPDMIAGEAGIHSLAVHPEERKLGAHITSFRRHKDLQFMSRHSPPTHHTQTHWLSGFSFAK